MGTVPWKGVGKLGESLGCVPWRHVGLHHHPLYQRQTGNRRLSAAVQPACKTDRYSHSARLFIRETESVTAPWTAGWKSQSEKKRSNHAKLSRNTCQSKESLGIVLKKLETLDNSKGESGEWDWSGIYRSVNSKSLYFLKQDDKYQDDKNVFILLIFKQYLHLYTVYFFGDTHI